MNFGPPTLFLLALVIGWARPAAPASDTLTGKPVGKDKPLVCNLPMLRSYLLKGMYTPTEEEPMLLCPTITSNCCTKADQQRIYHVVNDILPQRILNYEERVKTALASIKRFHDHVVANPPRFIGNARRRAFCMRQARSVYSFPFGQFFSRLYDTLIEANKDMRDYYNRFYCVLCDGRNQPFFQTGGAIKRLTFDAKFCQDTLQSQTDVINMLNVQLVSYLVSLQNLVDCKHYVRSYNLDFFAAEKIRDTVGLLSCMNFVNSREYLKYCKITCQKLNVGKMVTLIQGDLDFLNDAVNLFRKFFEFRESGNFVSAKLRKFFRTHVMEVAPSDLPDRALRGQTAFRKKDFRLLDKFKRLSEQHFKRAAATYKAEERSARNDKFIESVRLKKQAGLLARSPNGPHSAPAKNVKSGLRLDSGVNSGRVLAAAPQSKPAESPVEEKKVRAPKLNFGGGSAKTYEQIHIDKKDRVVEYVYRIQHTPIEFDGCMKVFQTSGGINPDFYHTLNFGMSQAHFNRRLFGEMRQESPDSQLHFLLADFNTESVDEAKGFLTHEFRIDPDNWAGLDAKFEK